MEHIDHDYRYISTQVIQIPSKIKNNAKRGATVDTLIVSIPVCKESAGSHFQNLIWILTTANAGYMVAVATTSLLTK